MSAGIHDQPPLVGVDDTTREDNPGLVVQADKTTDLLQPQETLVKKIRMKKRRLVVGQDGVRRWDAPNEGRDIPLSDNREDVRLRLQDLKPKIPMFWAANTTRHISLDQIQEMGGTLGEDLKEITRSLPRRFLSDLRRKMIIPTIKQMCFCELLKTIYCKIEKILK